MNEILTVSQIDDDEVSKVMDRIRGMDLMDVVRFVVLVIVLVVVVRLLIKLVDRTLSGTRINKGASGFLRSVIHIGLWFVAVIIAASALGVNVTSLIAILSVAGLALTLALQGVLSNLASGVVILATSPFKVGDYVCVGDSEGFVEEISMTYTRIVSWDKRTFFVPNSTVTGSTVMNYSSDGKRRVDMIVPVSYDCPVDDVKAALREAVEHVAAILPNQEVFVRLDSYQDSAINYMVRCWCLAGDYWRVWYDLLEEIKRCFDNRGIIFTYNHLNVHLDHTDEAVTERKL